MQKKNITIRLDTKRCKQCAICSELCPTQVYDQAVGEFPVIARPEVCTGCRLCEMRCPDFAIEVEVTRP